MMHVSRALSVFLVLQIQNAICQPTATVTNGTYIGVHNEVYGVDAFLALPYAQPPVGSLRLARPTSLNFSFNGARDATALGPACIQFQAATINRPMSEDCLTINVYRPAGYGNASLPVLFWIYGGGYVQGSNYDPRYNLTFLVNESVAMNKPIVAVGINYRLNTFGFLNSPTIEEGRLSNLGLHDQRLALSWVQENIAAFGGDPKRVTIWGQSAGAGSVGAQLLAYGGDHGSLFRAAIADSGGPAGFAGYNAAAALENFNSILSLTGCKNQPDALTCLRAVPIEVLSNAVNETGGSYAPAIDCTFMSTFPSLQLSQGDFAKVPLLIGSNTDEGTQFVGDSPSIGALPTVSYPNTTSFSDVVRSNIRNDSAIDTALAALSVLYPDIPAIGIPHSYHGRLNSTFGDEYKRVAAFSGDMRVHRGRRLASQSWAKHDVPIYSYLFDQWPVGGLPNSTGTTHFAEIQLVFQDFDGNGYLAPWYPSGTEFMGQDAGFYALSRLMGRMWISFVNDLTPNHHGVCTGYNGRAIPEWPLYAASSVDAAEGYGRNLVFGESDSHIAAVQPDTWRAEAIGYLIANSAAVFGV